MALPHFITMLFADNPVTITQSDFNASLLWLVENKHHSMANTVATSLQSCVPPCVQAPLVDKLTDCVFKVPGVGGLIGKIAEQYTVPLSTITKLFDNNIQAVVTLPSDDGVFDTIMSAISGIAVNQMEDVKTIAKKKGGYAAELVRRAIVFSQDLTERVVACMDDEMAATLSNNMDDMCLVARTIFPRFVHTRAVTVMREIVRRAPAKSVAPVVRACVDSYIVDHNLFREAALKLTKKDVYLVNKALALTRSKYAGDKELIDHLVSVSSTKECIVCHGGNANSCAQCGDAFYCSRECQKIDWKKHKKVCSGERIYSMENLNFTIPEEFRSIMGGIFGDMEDLEAEFKFLAHLKPRNPQDFQKDDVFHVIASKSAKKVAYLSLKCLKSSIVESSMIDIQAVLEADRVSHLKLTV